MVRASWHPSPHPEHLACVCGSRDLSNNLLFCLSHPEVSFCAVPKISDQGSSGASVVPAVKWLYSWSPLPSFMAGVLERRAVQPQCDA